MSNTKILSIESSCDETAVAIVEDGRKVLANKIYSQIDIHTIYGGVVPEIASRKHVEKLPFLVDSALNEANLTLKDVDAIAVTYGPGLVGALLTGVSYGKGLSYAFNKPLIAVNHIRAHINANFINFPELKPPIICLVVSGGHTNLILVNDYDNYIDIASTKDDAAGEAFDKVARVIGLGYPGGPKIDKAAKIGNPKAIDFPRARVRENEFSFSFSGIKSSVLNYINTCKMKNIEYNKNDIAASFQSAVVDVLVNNSIKASVHYGINNLAIAGGVAANSALRKEMQIAADKNNINLYYPDIQLCTDNAAMIGACAYHQFLKNDFADLTLNAVSNLEI